MPIDTLRDDLKANMMALKDLNALSSNEDIIKHLKNVLWPYMESMVDQIEDVDGCVEDLLNHAEDILQPETGALFLAVITGAVSLANELKARLTPADTKLAAAIAELEKNANEATAVLTEITIPVEDDEEDDEDEDGDDAEDEDEVE